MNKKLTMILMTIFFTLLFVYSLLHIIFWFNDNKHTQDITNQIYEDVIDNSIIIDGKNGNTNEKKEQTINFDKLIKKNKDTKGWLEVKGTNINYPFVQSKDNKYYLTHSFDKKYTDAGWVFLDFRNNIEELDKNTIIYGHARKDKSMFGTLKYTLNKSWYKNKDNQIIKLTTKDYEYEFQTFSTYHIKTEDYYIQNEFKNDNEFIKFLNTIKNRSTHNYNIKLDKNDFILTLSSCFSENQKVVLHAKLINKKIKDSI